MRSKLKLATTKARATAVPEKPHPVRKTGGYGRRNTRWDSQIGRWVTGQTVGEYMLRTAVSR